MEVVGRSDPAHADDRELCPLSNPANRKDPHCQQSRSTHPALPCTEPRDPPLLATLLAEENTRDGVDHREAVSSGTGGRFGSCCDIR